MRSTTRKRTLVSQLRRGRVWDGQAEALAQLPVASEHMAAKSALVNAVKELIRREDALFREIQALGDKLDRLPIKDARLE